MTINLLDTGFVGSLASPMDPDAAAYIAAVEAADGQALEDAVRTAIAALITGFKTDGIWSALRGAAIMSGPRTLAGALVPLVGSVNNPTNFTAGDYDRKTGLLNAPWGSNKLIRDIYPASAAHNLASGHLAAHLTEEMVVNWEFQNLMGCSTPANTAVLQLGSIKNPITTQVYGRSFSTPIAEFALSRTVSRGLWAVSRNGTAGEVCIGDSAIVARTPTAATGAFPGEFGVFGFSSPPDNVTSTASSFTAITARIAFCSVGQYVPLASLRPRLQSYIAAIAAAIP